MGALQNLGFATRLVAARLSGCFYETDVYKRPSLAYVDWNNDRQPNREEAFAKLIPRIHNGAVILLHSTSKTNAAILDELLTKWEDVGYRFDSLDALFA